MQKLLLSTVCSILCDMSMKIPDPRPRKRMGRLGIGLLCGDTPKTITSAIEWNGDKGDWSADYRLFSKTKWNQEDLFATVLEKAAGLMPAGPVFSAMDDTLIRKTGRRIPGTNYARDPLSPPFHVNLVLGQRFLQTAVMVQADTSRQYRAIPSPTATRLRSKLAKGRASKRKRQ